MPARGQVPLVSTAAGGDGAWGGAGTAGVLLLPALPPKLLSLRRRVGPGRRNQSGSTTVGLPGGDLSAFRGCCRRCAASFRERAAIGIDRAAVYRGRWRTPARPAASRQDGQADAAGAGMGGGT